MVSAVIGEAGNVPGTLHLVETSGDGHHGRTILHPIPSQDPEDPLNWSRARKHLAIGMVYLYTFGIGIATAVQYSVLTQISDATDITVSQLNLGTGLMFLFLGWACLIWQPLAMAYGRRGVYISSILLSIIPMVWAPYSRSVSEWYAHRALLGVFAAPVESLPEVTIPDLFFAHERGTYMSIYAFALFGSNFLAPFFAGFINDGAGWEWVMHFGSITLAVCAIIMIFLMEDTIYFRGTSEGLPSGNDKQTLEDPQTRAPGYPETVMVSRDAEQDFAPPRSRLQKLSLLTLLPDRPSKKQVMMRSWRAIEIFVFFPNIVWAGLLYGTSLAWYNILNATISQLLGGAPYSFSPAMVGVAYISPVIFGALASVWAGQFADWVALRLARRNKGIREPEQRLWSLALPALLGCAGMVLWGVGASQEIHFIGLIFGLGFVTFGTVCAGGVALAYAIDCFKEIGGESIITVIIIRNTLGFAFNYAINPWIDGMGLQNCFITVSMLILVCTSSFLFMTLFAKSLRRRSAKKY